MTTLEPPRPATGRGSRGGQSTARPGDMTEAQFQKRITDAATLYGWRWYHAPDNVPTARGKRQKIVRGFPDLVLVRGERLILAEVKTRTGKISPAQHEWLADLADTPVESYLWRPADWAEILSILDRTPPPGGLD